MALEKHYTRNVFFWCSCVFPTAHFIIFFTADVDWNRDVLKAYEAGVIPDGTDPTAESTRKRRFRLLQKAKTMSIVSAKEIDLLYTFFSIYIAQLGRL